MRRRTSVVVCAFCRHGGEYIIVGTYIYNLWLFFRTITVCSRADDVAISKDGVDPDDALRHWEKRGGAFGAGTWREALGGSVRLVRGDAHDRSRCHGGKRGFAGDSGRPRFLAGEPGLGSQRLSDRLRRPAAARRAAWGPPLPQGDILGRPWGVHGSLPALWPRAEPGVVGCGAFRAGCWRGHDLRGDPGHDRHDVPRAARAGEGHRRLRLRRLRRRGGRIARRRRSDPVDQLALDLLRERADWYRDGGARRTVDRGRQGHRVR